MTYNTPDKNKKQNLGADRPRENDPSRQAGQQGRPGNLPNRNPPPGQQGRQGNRPANIEEDDE